MTVSTHVYTARVMPADLDLGQVGGSLTLDTSRVPHVDGTVQAKITPALLAALDPRTGSRVQVTATRGDVSRVFDLGVREVTPDWAENTADVVLASDEALLEDFATLVQDRTPRTLETSARAVTEYVLEQIGATLEPGTVDADLTAQWPLDNLAIDPRCTTVTSWSFSGATATLSATTGIGSVLGTGATTCATATLTSTATRVDMRKTTTVTPDRTYSFRGAFRFNFAGGASGGRTCTARVLWMDKDNTPLGDSVGPTVVITDPGSAGAAPWTWLTVAGVTAPVGATQGMWILRGEGGSFPSGATVEATVWQPVEADDVVPYFDGYTLNDAVYAYTWTEDANVSVSHREPTIERDPDSLVWQQGQSAMDFLAPLLKANGIRLVCDEARAWSLRTDDYQADGGTAWRWGVNVTALDDAITLDDWYDAAVYEYEWTGRDQLPRVRRDVFALNTPPRKVLHVELSTPWPGPGRAEAMVMRSQDRGRVTTVTGIPAWTERTDQPVQITAEDGTILAGTAGTVAFSLDDDTVTITSRTTRIPAGAISLLTGTIDALTGTIDAL